MATNIGDLILQESKRLNGYQTYCSKPYGCCIEEALSHFKNTVCPDEKVEAQRKESETLIILSPTAPRIRKKYIIKLWIV